MHEFSCWPLGKLLNGIYWNFRMQSLDEDPQLLTQFCRYWFKMWCSYSWEAPSCITNRTKATKWKEIFQILLDKYDENLQYIRRTFHYSHLPIHSCQVGRLVHKLCEILPNFYVFRHLGQFDRVFQSCKAIFCHLVVLPLLFCSSIRCYLPPRRFSAAVSLYLNI